jgi:hypothetical protein
MEYQCIIGSINPAKGTHVGNVDFYDRQNVEDPHFRGQEDDEQKYEARDSTPSSGIIVDNIKGETAAKPSPFGMPT